MCACLSPRRACLLSLPVPLVKKKLSPLEGWRREAQQQRASRALTAHPPPTHTPLRKALSLETTALDHSAITPFSNPKGPLRVAQFRISEAIQTVFLARYYYFSGRERVFRVWGRGGGPKGGEGQGRRWPDAPARQRDGGRRGSGRAGTERAGRLGDKKKRDEGAGSIFCCAPPPFFLSLFLLSFFSGDGGERTPHQQPRPWGEPRGGRGVPCGRAAWLCFVGSGGERGRARQRGERQPRTCVL